MHGERHQSDADAAAAVCEQRTRETCVRARYRTVYGRHDIVRSMNPRYISRYHVIDMITTFTVTAADLKPLQPGNLLVKFADDTYLVIPSIDAGMFQQEMDNIATWVAANNLKLNVLKSRDCIPKFQTENSSNTATTTVWHIA